MPVVGSRLDLRSGLRGIGLLERIPEPTHSKDPHTAGFQLPAQAVHVDLDRVGRDFLAPFAQVIDELVFRYEAPGTPQEDFQQAQFARRKVDGLSLQKRGASDLVEGKRTVPEQGRTTRHAPPRKRTHARFELGQFERFAM